MRAPRLTAVLAALSLAGGLTALAPSVAAPAQAACATDTGKSISGTVVGQDGRDVNASIGIDLVDAAGRGINGGTPGSAGYGCAKTGGYSVPQIYLNHFVGPLGREPRTNTRAFDPVSRALRHRPELMRDGKPFTRSWRIDHVPSNAVGAYIEVYHRGYEGSPCRDSKGNYCFNPENHRKYGNANEHVVPVGTKDLQIRLPMTCAYQGSAGALKGRTVDAAGRPVAVKAVYAFTEAKWNGSPPFHGWGIATLDSGGAFTVPALASGQNYVLLVTRANGTVVRRGGVRVDSCRPTTIDVRV